MNITLLENIHPRAAARFAEAWGIKTTAYAGALADTDLKRALDGVQILGIRSKTQLTRAVLDAAKDLVAVGCFCIGTDQVDLAAARDRGIAVFNAPYANTRSVAELVIGEIICLMRRLTEKSAAAHRGEWLKSVDGATEMRGKTLGIVGYGHIGTQLSVLAEALGMRVVFYDIIDKLALGNAHKATKLDDLLAVADVVSLHVPATPGTDGMINAKTIKKMKRGAYVINASRGHVVDLDALNDALNNGHIAGAAIDVFPVEPHSKGDMFKTPLQGQKNVILTPHIGGSTEEAQENIAADVAEKLVRYMRDGVTDGSVNLPSVTLPPAAADATRFRHIHRNVPGVLAAINHVFSSRHVNIAGQYLQTDVSCGYVVIDANNVKNAGDVQNALRAIDGTIRAF